MHRIFIVEDDAAIAAALQKHLTTWGFDVRCAEDFRNVLAECTAFDPQLVLLDITLPFYNGYHWCQELRRVSNVPVVFISSASDNMNIVMAMNMGGDDFIAKPFDLNVLLAKIQAILRRTYDFAAPAPTLEHRGAVLNTADASLMYQGQRIELTKNDYRILQTLLERKGSVVSRETLMEKLWETDSFVDENNPFMHNVQRRQLEADYKVAQAKGAMREVTLFAQVGYTGADRTFGRSYRDLRDNQVVEVGVSIPLVDWGKRRAAVKVAESERELAANTLRKETLDFNSNLFILVERFNNQAEQLRLADRASEIAGRRYDTNVETFMIGRISTLDLSDSQANKDSARSRQLEELFYYWYYFYQLRSITLWDFSRNAPIDADIENLIKN